MSRHHRHYKHLHIPETWEQYWSKYPNGYTMLESLIDWVSQVNKMISSFNNLSDEYTTLNRNMRALEKELRASWKGYKEHTEKTYEDFRDEILTIVNQWIATIEPTIQDEVVNSLSGWLQDGTLADIINEDVFNMKANQVDLENVTAQLAQTYGKSFNNKLIKRHRYNRPSITITDDDAPADVYTKLKPLAEEYNIPFTIATITNLVGKTSPSNSDTYPGKKALTLEQMKELQKIGFEFVSHTHTHASLTDITDDELEKEMTLSKQWLMDNGFDGHDAMIYPYGRTNANVEIKTRENYRIGVRVDGGLGSMHTTLPEPYAVRRVFADRGMARAKEKIDEAVENNGWVIFGMHCWYDNWSEAETREIIEYAKARGLDFITLNEGVQRFGNIVDIPSEGRSTHFRIDANGHNNLVVEHTANLNLYDANTPIEDFPDNKITVVRVTTDYASSFPSGKAGLFVTNKLTEDPYVWEQKYYSYDTLYENPRILHRKVKSRTDTSFKEWGGIEYVIPLTDTFSGPLSASINAEGFVHLQGRLTVTGVPTGESERIGTLPTEQRPRRIHAFTILNPRDYRMVGAYVSDSGNIGISGRSFSDIVVGDTLLINTVYKV